MSNAMRTSCVCCNRIIPEAPYDSMIRILRCDCGANLQIFNGEVSRYEGERFNRVDELCDFLFALLESAPVYSREQLAQKRADEIFDDSLTDGDIRFLHEFAHVSTR